MQKRDYPVVPWRTQGPIYGAGFFASSLTDVTSIILPLWLAGTGASAAAIGLIIGAKHILPFFFAIHGGALMDRFGARRLMILCSMASVIALPLFPVVGWLPAVVALQMLSGFGSAMGWLGAQTLFGQTTHGNPALAGRFAFALRMGGFVGPPLAGLAWDHTGVAGGFAFLCLWAFGTVACSFLVPRQDDVVPEGGRRLRAADLAPKVADYRAALRLATIPAMSVVLMVTVVRIAASSVQDSFYPLYLHTIGFSATEIGVLMTTSAATAAASALLIGHVLRYMSGMWALVIATAGSVIFVSITPLMTSFTAFAVVGALRGVCMGVSQPLMLSMLIEVSGRGSQGKGAALRTTANRAAATITPISMGVVAAFSGLAASFLIVGGALLGAVGLIAIHLLRRPHLARD
ncbi:MAG: putative arabinose efflux permease, family [Hyphomicrobiales bacterium]|nr:putative arabinose efflux permease, family [Hyphomicrobiales bacterium]